MRRILLPLVSAIVLVDIMFYSAITPLLPEYADRFGLSKTGAGILAGTYAAGALLGTFPSAWLATRRGSRTTMLVGLTLMALASFGFAFGESIAALDAMRFLQGLGGAFSWVGGMGWLISITPLEQRGQTIGTTMGAAVAGALLGPVLGGVAHGIGPEATFAGVGVLGVALMLLAARLEAPPHPAAATQPIARTLGDPRIRTGAWLVLVPALVFGAVEVLAPLELDALGASGMAIAATFFAAAAVEIVVQVLAGHATDRWGRSRPIRISLVGMVVFLLLVPLPSTAWLLAAIVGFGCVLTGVLNTPAMTLLSDGAEGAGLDHGVGFAVVNFVWASGQVAGAAAGGAIAAATGDAVVYLGLAALCATTLAAMIRAGDRRTLARQPA